MMPSEDLPMCEQVAIALCSWVNGKKRSEMPEVIWLTLKDEQKAAYREQAEAAINACGAEEMKAVLELLVYAKEMKERAGDSPAYRAKKEEGWTRARAILAKFEVQP